MQILNLNILSKVISLKIVSVITYILCYDLQLVVLIVRFSYHATQKRHTVHIIYEMCTFYLC